MTVKVTSEGTAKVTAEVTAKATAKAVTEETSVVTVKAMAKARGSSPRFSKISNPLYDPQKCSDMFNLLVT